MFNAMQENIRRDRKKTERDGYRQDGAKHKRVEMEREVNNNNK